MPRLNLAQRRERRVKKAHDKFYSGLNEIIIKLGERELFRGHKNDSVVNGILRANPGASIEWVDKSRVDEIILRGIK